MAHTCHITFASLPGPLTTSPATPPPVTGSCPGDDWTKWGSLCFWSPGATQLSWINALERCVQEGGRHASLAVLNSSDLNWIALQVGLESGGLPTQPSWIGLYKDDVPGGKNESDLT